MTHAEAGHRGGVATLERHGKLHFIKCGMVGGRKGGRPRSKTIEDVKAPCQIQTQEDRLPAGLKAMVEALRHKENLTKGGLAFRTKTDEGLRRG